VSRRRVVVLAGGLSHEREVSLRSGARVAAALEEAGLDVTVKDVGADLLVDLQEDRPDCVVPLLHGEAGEGGSLQELLELAGVAYVGSRPAAARAAFAKPVAKHIVRRAGLLTPASVALEATTFREVGASVVLAALVERLGLPLFVKPAAGGSALGCSTVSTADQLPGAMVNCYAYGPLALVERFVDGTEVAIPVVDTGGGPAAMPAVQIRPEGGVYDYAARYTAGATEFVVPAEIPPDVAADCARVAETAHRSLGLRDLSRSDLIIDAAGAVWFLEANVAPGMTETSLVPLSLSAARHTVGEVLERLCVLAETRFVESR
jgi:D-alanine-D-alanine ligase